MIKFDVRQLEVFIAVTEQASFSKAGKLLGMAQASVSERIAGLEKNMGARLLNRLGRRVELTSVGEHFITRARAIILLRNETAAEMMEYLDTKTGDVKVGGSTAPGEYFMPGLLGKFNKSYPEIRALLTIADSERIIESIEEGTLDLGVVGRRESTEHLQFVRLWNDRLVLVVQPGHPLADHSGSVDSEALLNERWVMRELGSATRSTAEKLIKKVLPGGLSRLDIAAEFGSVTAVKQGVKAGLGIAVMSAITVNPDVESGTLKIAPIKELSGVRPFYLVRDKRRSPSPTAELLWKFLESVRKKPLKK